MKENKLNQEESNGEMDNLNEDELNDQKKPENEADLTEDDLEALGPKDANLNIDGGDDQQLRHRDYDFTGEDLDVPGSELDDNEEAIGEEDEENNSYSIGGDGHDDLEEDANRI